MKNIIILTSGLSGSSVITNLISQIGYWTGDSTCKKIDYNTHENSQLVYLNEQLLKQISYETEYSSVIRADKFLLAEKLYGELDLTPFKAFINECNQAGAWLWKDPRLWVTMPFWIQLLDKKDFQVIFVDRSISQRWISELLRRNIQSYGYCSQYNRHIEELIKQFIEKHHLQSCNVLFDDLIERPDSTLLKINQLLGSDLNVDSLKAVYNKPLYQKPRGIKDLLLAIMIYLKNYHLRLS